MGYGRFQYGRKKYCIWAKKLLTRSDSRGILGDVDEPSRRPGRATAGHNEGAVKKNLARLETKRYRLSIPVTDEAVTGWLDAQDNVNVSLRLLIQKQVRQDGGIRDLLAMPTDQLPKRLGRPKGSGTQEPPAKRQTQAPEAPWSPAPEPRARSAAPAMPIVDSGAAYDQGPVGEDPDKPGFGVDPYSLI